MERAVGHHLHNRVLNFEIKKDEAKSHVLKFFNFCKENSFKPMLYYTGHGELPTGNWCLADGTISIEEIFDWMPTGMEPPTICTDSCFSGVWADYCIQKKVPGLHCLSATVDCQAAYDHKEGGGELTHYMTGNESKLECGRPSTEPLFSRGINVDFPTLKKYTKTNYNDFNRFFTHGNQETLIWQSIHGNYMSSVFGHHKKYNDKKKQFWVSSSFKEVKEQMKVHSKSDFNIYSLAVDQKTGKFYVYMQEGFGSGQTIIQTEDPEDHYMPGLSVTSVACLGKTYFLVITAGVNEYENKDQIVFTSRSRSELDTEIKRQRDRGMVITSFCVNSDQKEYVTVMTEMEGQGQESRWWDDSTADGSRESRKWADDLYSSKKFVYTIVCTDPSDDQCFYLMTKDDDRSGYSVRYASFFT
ncbi:uncharacterized protein LOC134855207 isoform X2 [Symsagittifera roscoffensis]